MSEIEQAKIRVEGLNFYYGEKRALTDLHLAIPEHKMRSSGRRAAANPRFAASTG